MKRKIALFLTMVMLCAAMLPVQAFAEKDKVLEDVVTKVKQMFSIPSSYTFSPEAYSDNGKKFWSLNWSGKEGDEGSISVRVDEKGTILSYDNWKPYDYSKKKLPKISSQDAKVKAEEFIKKVNPSVLPNIKLADNNNELMGFTYNFSYTRMVNGIPFYNNTVSVNVSKETGEIQSYNCNWNEGLVFPDTAKKITLDAAKKAYIEKLGLKLIYKYNYENEKLDLYVVYIPKYESSYAIDALTGEKIRLNGGFDAGFGGAGGQMLSKEAAMDTAGVTLAPEEIKAIEDVSKMISQEAAEKIARDFKVLSLTGDYKLSNANLSRNWPLRDEYVWYLNFNKESKEARAIDIRGVSVGINAKTGEIINFNRNTNSSESDKAKYNEAQAKQAVEDFLKSFKAEKFKEVEYDDSNPVYNLYESRIEGGQRSFNFNYSRKVKNAYFPDNMISVEFDAVTGEISSLNMNWFDVEFPAIDKVLDVSKVYEKLFGEIGIELQYKANYPEEYFYRGVMPENGKLEVNLIYALKPGKPQILDAYTGNILSYDGKEYKDNKPVVYTDIKGHNAEKQITVLSEYGVSFDLPEFRPDENITQLDFFILLSKTLNNYYKPVITSSSSKDDIDKIYTLLIREGLVKENEKNPSAIVTKEEAIKFIIRAMKFDKVADIKDIFKCSFKDVNKIDAGLIGYVAIAQGLKIVNGNNGYFYPKSKLTRAQAAILIYNYLQG